MIGTPEPQHVLLDILEVHYSPQSHEEHKEKSEKLWKKVKNGTLFAAHFIYPI
jgi:hypothetical protein